MNHFKLALEFQEHDFAHASLKLNKGQYEDKTVTLLKFIKREEFSTICFRWKVKKLERFLYNSHTNSTFQAITNIFMNHGYYNSAINFAVSHHFLGELGMPFVENLCKTGTLDHFVKLIKGFQDPLLKGEALLKLSEEITDLDYSYFGYSFSIFDIITVLPKSYYVTYQEGFIKIILALLKAKQEDWMIVHLLNKMTSNYEDIALKLSSNGFFRKAIDTVKRMDKGSYSQKYSYGKAMYQIGLDALEKGEYAVADEAVSLMLDERKKKEMRDKIKQKREASIEPRFI